MLGTTKQAASGLQEGAVNRKLPFDDSLPAAGRTVAKFLWDVDVRINGGREWDIQVHDPRMYQRILSYGSIGVGESYVNGWWDVEALDQFFARVNRADPSPQTS